MTSEECRKGKKLLDKIMNTTGDELKDRLREKCQRLVWLIDESAPSIILSLEVAQLFWNATALLGTQVWEEVGKSIVPFARNRMGKCQECEEDIAVEDSHPHYCPGCEERVKQEAEAMEKEINKNA